MSCKALNKARAKIQSDLNAGFRRMRLAYHFHPSEDQRTEEQKTFYLKNIMVGVLANTWRIIRITFKTSLMPGKLPRELKTTCHKE